MRASVLSGGRSHATWRRGASKLVSCGKPRTSSRSSWSSSISKHSDSHNKNNNNKAFSLFATADDEVGLETVGDGSPSSSSSSPSATILDCLAKGTVVPVAGEKAGSPVNPASLWDAEQKEKHCLLFLSHFGDLTSWEYAQKLRDNMDVLKESSDGVTVVGLGSPEAGRKFAELLNFPVEDLYADPEGTLYKELGFSQGFLPDTDISPYLKLLPMLAGIGSPGTIQEVLRGYVGDKDAKPIFDGSTLGSLFDIVGKGYQRPFELATLRLQNMVGILPNWSELVSNDDLITQQGGTMVFEGSELIHMEKDTGILKYASVDKLIEALQK